MIELKIIEYIIRYIIPVKKFITFSFIVYFESKIFNNFKFSNIIDVK